MKNIHYFQRYSQKENWITNSTLLLLNRLYLNSVLKFKEFIAILINDENIEAEFGIQFGQQIHTDLSVPDGMINQKSIQILVETKLHDKLNTNQLIRHLSAFEIGVEQKILLGLSKFKVDSNVRKKIIQEIKAHPEHRGIQFISVTYKEIYDAFQQIIAEYDYELSELIDDYMALCLEEELIENKEYKMLAVTAGTSIDENLKYGIYYDPSERKNNQSFKYLGLYTSKSIVAIGNVNKIVECDLLDNDLIIHNEVSITENEKKRIINIINETDYYDLRQGSKFYLIDEFFKTDFKKSSQGPMRNKNYFDLSLYIDLEEGVSAFEIAEKLKKVAWE